MALRVLIAEDEEALEPREILRDLRLPVRKHLVVARLVAQHAGLRLGLDDVGCLAVALVAVLFEDRPHLTDKIHREGGCGEQAEKQSAAHEPCHTPRAGLIFTKPGSGDHRFQFIERLFGLKLKAGIGVNYIPPQVGMQLQTMSEFRLLSCSRLEQRTLKSMGLNVSRLVAYCTSLGCVHCPISAHISSLGHELSAIAD